MKPNIKDIIEAVRILEVAHQPEYQTGASVGNLSALCDEIERLTPKFEIGETVTVKMDSDYEQIKGVIIATSESKNAGKRYCVLAHIYSQDTPAWFDEDRLCKQQTPASNHTVRELAEKISGLLIKS